MNFEVDCYSILILQFISVIALAEQNQKTHILLFLVDDLGWNDVGFHGMTEIPTPNIDALAYNGIILNNYYTYALCSPSRSALLTGKLATSTGLQHTVIINGQPAGLPLNLKILPEFLKDLGYVSHIVGKWHLGYQNKGYTPTERGFKSHYGFWQSECNFFSHVSRATFPRQNFTNVPPCDTRETIELSGPCLNDGFKNVNNTTGEYMTDLFTKRSVDIIQKHNDSKPLFLYVAHHGVHRGDLEEPIRGPGNLTALFTNLENDANRQNFAGALTAVDRSLGDIMEALEERQMLKNTLVVFSSDNGAPLPGTFTDNGGSNYPLRGGKGSVWDGGVRVPAFIWSEGLQKRGFVYNGLMHIVDWLPTLYAAAGGEADIVKQHKLDALDLWPAITGNASSPRTQVLLQWDSYANVKAFRSGDYKIISGETFQERNETSSGHGPPPSRVQTSCSKTERVLKRTYGSSVQIQGVPIQVTCGSPSDEKCDPVKAPCLFNVVEDPCEMRNLATKMPHILEILQEEMRRITTVEPNFPDLDFMSNPDFYGGYWTNWLDDPYDLNVTAYCQKFQTEHGVRSSVE